MDLDLLEAIDFANDQVALERLQDDLTVLNRYYDEISSTGGISRSQAQQLVRDCGLNFGSEISMASFTELPTRTNLNVSLEFISQSTRESVWNIVKKTAEYLIKVLKWIGEVIRKAILGGKDAARYMASAIALDELYQLFRGQEDVAATSPFVDKAQQQLNAATEQYRENFNDLCVDLLTDRSIYTTVYNVSVELLHYHEILEKKIQIFEEAVARSHTYPEGQRQFVLTQMMATLAEPVKLTRLSDWVNQLTGQHNETVRDTMRSFADFISGKRATTSEFYDSETAFAKLENDSDQYTRPITASEETMVKVYHHVVSQLERIERLPLPASLTHQDFAAVKRGFDGIAGDLEGLRYFMLVAQGCLTVRDQLIHDVFMVKTHTIQIMRARIEVNGDVQTKNRLRHEAQKVVTKIRA